jgi:hypothetical protein
MLEVFVQENKRPAQCRPVLNCGRISAKKDRDYPRLPSTLFSAARMALWMDEGVVLAGWLLPDAGVAVNNEAMLEFVVDEELEEPDVPESMVSIVLVTTLLAF